jgi:hypothetical protein
MFRKKDLYNAGEISDVTKGFFCMQQIDYHVVHIDHPYLHATHRRLTVSALTRRVPAALSSSGCEPLCMDVAFEHLVCVPFLNQDVRLLSQP